MSVSEFRHIGIRESENKLFDIASAEITIGKIPIGKRKRSALTVVGFGDSRVQRSTTDLAKSRSPILECKEGIR
jgi:hypothetical protein